LRLVPLLSSAWLVAASAAAGEGRWRAELAVGGAHSFDSTLRVEQAAFPALTIEAGWATRSFDSPVYYAWRLARADGRGAWALRFVHHKVHLEDTTPEVERFSVTHGYNLLTLERAFVVRGFEISAGGGLVIAHPESTVRGQTRPEGEGGPLGGGYYVTGPTAALAGSRRVPLGRHLAVVPEVRFTLSRARVPVAEGEASVPNAALHLLVGLEARF
jgi:hypothetical protein